MAKIKGPLTLGSEAADTDYNAKMAGLMDQLIKSPEQQEKDELLAWSGGLSDPAGQGRIGDSITNANKAQSANRLEQDKLRAQYIPLIMNALGAQAASALAGGIGMGQLKGMPLEQVYQLTVSTGKDLMPAWKMANGMETAKPGDYRYGFDNGQTRVAGVFAQTDKPNPVLDQSGNVIGASNVPGGPAAVSELAGATSYGQEAWKRYAGTRTIIGPDNAKMEIPTRLLEDRPPAMFGGQGGPSQGGAVPPPTAPAGGVPTAPAGPLPGTISPPAGPIPAGGPAAPGSAALAGPVGPKISPQQQAALDSDRQQIYAQEMVAAQKRLAAATTPEEKARAEGDIVALANEAKRVGVQFGNAPATTIKAPAPVVTTPAQPQLTQPRGGYQIELSPGQIQANKNTAELATGFIKSYDELKNKNFAQDEQNLRQAEAGLSRLGKTGPFTTEARKQAAEIMAAFGVQADEKYLSNYQMVEQGINTRVNAAIMADRGVATEGDAKRHKEATLNLKGTPEYNRYMLDTYKATLARDKQKLDFFQEAMKNRGKIPDGDLERINIAWQQKIQKPLMDMPSMAQWKKRYGWK